MTTGIFKLTEHVVNPARDGRIKHDWTKMDFEPGTYRVTEERVELAKEQCFSYLKVTKVGAREGFDYLTSGTPEGKILLAVLSPKARTVRTVLQEECLMDCHASYYIRVLETLVADGKLTIEDFEAAVLATLQEEAEENEL